MGRLFLLHGGALGDCVLALHFADVVRRMMAAERVVFAARSSIVLWARRVGWIDEAITLDVLRTRERPATSRGRAGACDSGMPRRDVVVSMTGPPEPELLNRLEVSSNARVVTIDPREESSRAAGGRHIVEQWIGRLAESCAAQGCADEVLSGRLVFDPAAPAFRPDPSYRVAGRAALAHELRVEDGRSIVVVHPGSGSARKCPPIEMMETLVDALAEEGRSVPAWMIGPDEWERQGDAFHRRLAQRAPVLWREDLQSAVDLVAGTDMYLGLDAGMTHVAAVCARRTIAIFGPTDPAVWRPVGDSCDVVGFPTAIRHSSGATGWLREISDMLRTR